MSLLLRLVAVLALTVFTFALPASSASALSCADPSGWMPDADHVFTGRVAEVRGNTMQVEVSEVWQGDDLSEHVWLEFQKGMEMWFPFSSNGAVPDGYSSPTEYVIATQDDFVVSPCGMWARSEPMEYGVAGERSPRPPVAPGATGVEPAGTSLAPAAMGGAGVLGVGALALVLWRRHAR